MTRSFRQLHRYHFSLRAAGLLCLLLAARPVLCLELDVGDYGESGYRDYFRDRPTDSLTLDRDSIAMGLSEEPLPFHRVTLFNPRRGEDSERLWSQTKLIFGLGLGVAGALYAMPEETTNWDKSQTGNLHTRWWNNVSQGPVWDRDDYIINNPGHIYFGGVYYQVARKSGYGQWDSFVYSALVSTFYWEYGLEAFAEVPSIQDIIITPIGGWIYGEWAYQQEQKIIAGDGKVMGSRRLGQVSLFFLDPVDAIGRGLNRLTGTDWIKTGRMSVLRQPVELVNPNTSRPKDVYWGVQLVLHF